MKKRDSFNYYDTSEEIIYDNESLYYYDDVKGAEQKFNGTMEFTAVKGHNLDYNIRPLGNDTMLIGVPAQHQYQTNANNFIGNYQNQIPVQPHIQTQIVQTPVHNPTVLAPYEQYLQSNNYVYPTNYNDFPNPVPHIQTQSIAPNNPYEEKVQHFNTTSYNNNHQPNKSKQQYQKYNGNKNKRNYGFDASTMASYDNLNDSESMFYENYESQLSHNSSQNQQVNNLNAQHQVKHTNNQEKAMLPTTAVISQSPVVEKKVLPEGPNPYNSRETQELIQQTVQKQNEINKASYQKHVQSEQKTRQLEKKVNELQQMLTNVTTNFGKAVSTLSSSLNNTQEMLKTRQTQTLSFKNDDYLERNIPVIPNNPNNKKPNFTKVTDFSSKRRR